MVIKKKNYSSAPRKKSVSINLSSAERTWSGKTKKGNNISLFVSRNGRQKNSIKVIRYMTDDGPRKLIIASRVIKG